MITFNNNVLSFDDKTIEMPIRILYLMEIKDYIIVCIGFSWELDCGYDNDNWTHEIKDKWNKLHKEFNKPSVYCFDKKGNIIWKFHRHIAGLKIYSKEGFDYNVNNNYAIASWLKENNRSKDEFILLDGEDLYLVELKTGKEVLVMETR